MQCNFVWKYNCGFHKELLSNTGIVDQVSRYKKMIYLRAVADATF